MCSIQRCVDLASVGAQFPKNKFHILSRRSSLRSQSLCALKLVRPDIVRDMLILMAGARRSTALDPVGTAVPKLSVPCPPTQTSTASSVGWRRRRRRARTRGAARGARCRRGASRIVARRAAAADGAGAPRTAAFPMHGHAAQHSARPPRNNFRKPGKVIFSRGFRPQYLVRPR